MTKIFEEGGPLNVKHSGGDVYELTVAIPKGEDGRVARECIRPTCSPGYFKLLLGTGLTSRQAAAFCPYCRASAPPQEFTTEEQRRYAKDVVIREALGGFNRALKSTLGLNASGRRTIGGGLIAIEMSVKTDSPTEIRRPFDEDVRRDVVCPHCGLDHSTYGLAVWCSDCGKDIFLTHVAAEVSVVRLMLADIPRRREQLGTRVAAKDIENCLEDTVSIMEAVLRALARRALMEKGNDQSGVEAFFKKIGNTFQSLERTQHILREEFQINVAEGLGGQDFSALAETLEKRHPIAHNLGVIDRKYIQRARTAEEEGREILVSEPEIQSALDSLLALTTFVHGHLFALS